MATAGVRSLAMVMMIGLSFFTLAQTNEPRIDQIATTDVTALEATITVVKADQDELKKINRDFGMAYRLKDIVMRYKKPDKLRMDGHIGKEAAFYIVNGSMRYVGIPKLHFSKKDDLGNAPGKRYSLLEIGLICRSDLPSLQSKFIRHETLDSTPTVVFEINYRGDTSGHYVVWVDPHTHVILKREWYDGSGKLRATFNYQDVQEIKPGLWLPTRLEILNSEGIVAGVTNLSNLKLDPGLADSLFEIS